LIDQMTRRGVDMAWNVGQLLNQLGYGQQSAEIFRPPSAMQPDESTSAAEGVRPRHLPRKNSDQ
jgi:hypothetical protein